MTFVAGEASRERAVRDSGAWAFHRGRAYETNPYTAEQITLRLWWSEGYNDARVAKVLKDQEL